MDKYHYEDFDSWFHELEGFCTRSERCYDDYDVNKNINPLQNLRRWLQAAFYSARLQERYQIDLQEAQNGDLILEFPKELLISNGWEEGTQLEWLDNGNGSWTIKEKR